MKITKCIFCGSEEITEMVKIYADSAHNIPIRACFENEKKSFFNQEKPEYLYADMCNSCGSVIRFYAGTPHSNWITGEY